MNVYIEVVPFDMLTAQSRCELYRVLSEPVRLRLLALVAEDELAIGELAELLGESQPNVSRHMAPLKQAELVTVRKQGTRALVRFREAAEKDAVVADALSSGRAVCEGDGSLARVSDVIAQREASAREFFARPREDEPSGAMADLGPYAGALAALLPSRDLAVDAGTGDGAFLDVLAPAFRRVIAIDRSEAQLARARARAEARGFENVTFFQGGVEDPQVRDLVGHGADAVFGVRLLHHAPKPGRLVKELAGLCRAPHESHAGGALVLLDYAHHDDEQMRAQADVWLGFERAELLKLAREASLSDAHVERVPSPLRGVDAHLPWQVLVARVREVNRESNGSAHAARRKR